MSIFAHAMESIQCKENSARSANLIAMYEVTVATGDALQHAKTPDEFYRLLCQAAVENDRFLTCAVLTPDPASSWMNVEEVAGAGSEMLRHFRISIDPETPEGRGIAGEAFRTRTTCISNDFLNDPCTEPWHLMARENGIAAGAAVPILFGNESMGVLLLHSAHINAFEGKIVHLLGHIASSIAFALANYENEIDRTCAEDSLRLSEEKYRTILETLQEAYYEVDLKGRPILHNAAYYRILGYTPEEIGSANIQNFLTSESADQLFNAFEEVQRTGESKQDQHWKFLHKNGSIVHVEGSVNLALGPRGEPIGFRGIFRDITGRKKTEEALRSSEARFRALTNLSSDWYWELDHKYCFTRVESRHEKEKTLGPLLGKPIWDCGYDIDIGWGKFSEIVKKQEPFRDVIMHRRSSPNQPFYISTSGEPVFDSSGNFIGYRGVSREITEQKMADEQIQYLATHDGLTGLPNRVMFSHLLSNAVKTGSRYERNFAVLFIDLDRFKFINDTLGHDAGDKLLQEISARFKRTLRASDVVARLGGDEFVVLVQEMNDASQAALVARKLLSETIKPVVLMGQECRVTASIGVALYPLNGSDEQSLMKNADIAMYFAKEEGKNNFQFYSQDIKTHSLERLTLESNLRHALERDEFTVHYQAKVDLKKGTISGVEALLRWQNPALGNIPPSQFIPIAEETGMILQIGKWVLQTACAQNMEWQRQGLPSICVAVNLSARQFSDEHLLYDIEEVLKTTGMPPHLLELEITEGMVIQHPAEAIKLLTAIKAMGVRLAIDDFGTGYSSLGQLKTFPIDTLKVDRSFIRDLATDSGDKAITEAIITMGKTLSLTVVAEGVETVEQEAFLREHACDEMQGYYFSKPIAADEFAALLRTHELKNKEEEELADQ